MNSHNEAKAVPLCVDLDGTLLRTDCLYELVIALLRTSPLTLLWLPIWLFRGRAFAKHKVTAKATIAIGLLPTNQEFLAFLRQEHDSGRRLILVTAAPMNIAQAVADYFGIFSDVFASDERTNLRGPVKAKKLLDLFGNKGFDYAGNSNCDMEVWKFARSSIVVNSSTALAKQAQSFGSPLVFDARKLAPSTVLKALRIRQWPKNLLVIVPVLTAHRLFDPSFFVSVFIGFCCLCFLASGLYILNDLLDLETDRKHPLKRERSFASGRLSLVTGIFSSPILVVLSLYSGYAFLGPKGLSMLVLYAAASTLYSFFLKQVLLVDILVLAGLYTLRILAGGVFAAISTSEWLAAFSLFFFLSLAILKRCIDLRTLRNENIPSDGRRAYSQYDIPTLEQMGISSGYVSVLLLALWIQSPVVAELYLYPQLLWGLCVLLLYWNSRAWILLKRGRLLEDPVAFASHDATTYLIAAIALVIIVLSSQSFL